MSQRESCENVPNPTKLKRAGLLFCAVLFLLAGFFHFAKPSVFDQAMPDWVPAHKYLISVTGFLELAGGIGLLLPIRRLQQLTSICLALFLIMVFPVNINMALNPQLFPSLSPLVLWLRLPLQPLLILLVLWSVKVEKETA